ncbi:MAG: HD domain-containing protein [Bacteroidales bacterium]|nr:HD domain-containing protein [Bacteroidales bacterium]
MNKNEIIEKTSEFVKGKLEGDSSGHDWWHIFRVWNMSKKICKKEGGELFTIEMAALLHDVADWKFYENENEGLQLIREFLLELKIDKEIINDIIEIVRNVSFKGAGVADKMNTLEGMIVQDADRLDAIGATGVARTFAFGGKFGNEIYNPEIKIKHHNNFEEYKNDKGTTINHFYEKLLLLKDRMHTDTAKQIAKQRHLFMEVFLEQFYNEWESLK